jgi:hypothetical protein
LALLLLGIGPSLVKRLDWRQRFGFSGKENL